MESSEKWLHISTSVERERRERGSAVRVRDGQVFGRELPLDGVHHAADYRLAYVRRRSGVPPPPQERLRHVRFQQGFCERNVTVPRPVRSFGRVLPAKRRPRLGAWGQYNFGRSSFARLKIWTNWTKFGFVHGRKKAAFQLIPLKISG